MGNRTASRIREPDPVNILTALAENESVVKKGSNPERKAIALAWLFLLWVTYTNPYTRRSYSLWNIPTATGVEMRSVFSSL
jgi:hypothetical protein